MFNSFIDKDKSGIEAINLIRQYMHEEGFEVTVVDSNMNILLVMNEERVLANPEKYTVNALYRVIDQFGTYHSYAIYNYEHIDENWDVSMLENIQKNHDTNLMITGIVFVKQ